LTQARKEYNKRKEESIDDEDETLQREIENEHREIPYSSL
jgi:hypothetical protein